MKYQIERSSQVDERNMKILFWGDTGTRKTETILRNFPRVLLIDTEFNSDQAVDVPEIPEFMRYQTKDIRVIMEIIDEIKNGKLLFFDGQPVETFAIDSVTVLYSTAQEFGYKIAENRALKYNRDISTANMTQGDWAMIKRPLKQLQNQINGTGIRYLCLTARQKDLYEENEKGELKRIGVVEDTVKGLKYEMNLSLQFGYSPKSSKWFYKTDKVQGGLKNIFPMFEYGEQFPMEELEAYTRLKKISKKVTLSEADIADDMIVEGENKVIKPSKEGLIEIAVKNGFTKDEVLPILTKYKIEKYDETKWDAMIEAISREAEVIRNNGKPVAA